MWKHTILSKAFFVGLLLFCGTVKADEPPAGSLNLFLDFTKSKGLFNYLPSDQSPDDTAQTIRNVDFKRNQSLRRRNGISRFGKSDSNVMSGANGTKPKLDLFISTNNAKFLITRFAGEIFYWGNFDTMTGSENNASQALVPGGLIGQYDGIAIEDFFYIVHEGTAMIKLSQGPPAGLDVKFLEGNPAGKFASLFLGHFLIAGSTIGGQENRIRYSTSTNVEIFPAFNFLDLPPLIRGDKITGIGESLLGVLPVYTGNTTRMITGTVFPETGTAGNVAVRPISETIGCIHHDTIENLGNRQYFFSKGHNGSAPGIYYFNGVGILEASKPIRKYFIDNISVTTTPIPSAFIYKNAYCLQVATTGANTLGVQICLDEEGRYTIYEDFELGDYSVYNNKAYGVIFNRHQIVEDVVDQYDFLYNYDSGGQDSISLTIPAATVTWRYQTKDYDMGTQNRNNSKVADRAYVKFNQGIGTFTVVARYDFNKSSTTWTINTSTSYNNTSIQTVLYTTNSIINKLLFPQRPTVPRFNYINFDFSGSYDTEIDYLDFYAYLEPKT